MRTSLVFYIDCFALQNLTVDAENILASDSSVQFTNLRSLSSLKIGDRSCQYVLNFELGRVDGFSSLIDTAQLREFSAGKEAFLNCKSARLLSRLVFSF